MENIVLRNNKIEVDYTGYELFQKNIVNCAGNIIKTPFLSKREDVEQTIEARVLGAPKYKGVQYQFTKEEKLILKIFEGFTGISAVYENLLDSEIYIRQFPRYTVYGGRKITRSRYLQYHVEKYWQEVYILQQRLKEYSTNIGRDFFRKNEAVTKLINELNSQVYSCMENVIDVRKEHVHRKKFFDYGLDRMDMFDLLNSKEDVVSRKYVVHEFNKIRNNWVETVTKNNKALKIVLDNYFDVLSPLVFNQNGSFRF